MDPLVVATCSSDELLAAMGRLTVPFIELAPATTQIDRGVDGCPMYVGDSNGLAYLVETDRTFLAMCWGFLARVSEELDALVIGVFYETAEEHSEFFVVDRGEVVRAFWNSPPKATRPFSQGVPLYSEATVPLETPNGVGLAAALQAFGFPLPDCQRGFDSLPGERCVAWPGDVATLYASDEYHQQVNEHVRRYPNSDYRPPQAVVRVRRADE